MWVCKSVVVKSALLLLKLANCEGRLLKKQVLIWHTRGRA